LSAAQQQFAQNKSSNALAAISANQQRIEDATNAQIAAKNVENQGYAKAYYELALVDKKGLIDKAIAEIKATSERSTESERFVAQLKNLRANGTPAQVSQFLADWRQAKGTNIGPRDIGNKRKSDPFGLKTDADIQKEAEADIRISSAVTNPQAPGEPATPGQPATSVIVPFSSLNK
jgi:hypothetical protein